MVILGVDAHKRTHTLVAVDEVGRKLGERTVSATQEGHLDAMAWAASRSLRHEPMLRKLDDQLHELKGTVAHLARELVARCRALNLRVDELQHEIGRIVRRMVPALLALAGCGELSAAKIVGEVAGAGRFRSRAASARWNGMAPIPVWSANDARQRLNRSGNRQINAALHRNRHHSVAWAWTWPGVCAAAHGSW
jgi:transposase